MVELPTYTAVFRLKRRLYAIYDWELPVPVGLLEVGVFAAGVAVCALLAELVGVPLSPGSAWFFIVPPGFLAYAARRPLADAKQPHAWAWARVRYALEPRRLHDLADRPPRQRREQRSTLADEPPGAAPLTDEAASLSDDTAVIDDPATADDAADKVRP